MSTVIIAQVLAAVGVVLALFGVRSFLSVAQGDRKDAETAALLVKRWPLLLAVQPFLSALTPVLAWSMPPGYRLWAEKKLVAGGLSMDLHPEQLWCARFPIAVAVWFAMLYAPLNFRILVTLFMLAVPDMMLWEFVKARQAEIRTTLCYVVDILALCSTSGLEMGQAFDRVIESGDDGPIFDELKVLRRENALGVSQIKALENMSHRIQMPEVTAFCAILTQAMKMGASIAAILESQAKKMRFERFEKAERFRAKAQQALMIPLILFILPAFFCLAIVPIFMGLFLPLQESGVGEMLGF